MRSTNINCMAVALMAFLATGCTSNVQFASSLSPNGNNKNDSCVGDGCALTVNETYQVPNSTGKADVLFVMDTTPSMFLTVMAMATRLSGLLDSWSFDWQVGITNASLNATWDTQYFSLGQLLPLTPNPNEPESSAPFTVLTPQTPSSDDLFSGNMNFHYATYQGGFCAQEPFCTVGPAQPMNEIISMINNRAQANNQQFFRDGAYLVPIIISASDENGGKPLVQPSDVINAFKQNLGSSMAGIQVYSIIIKPGDTSCLAQYSSIFAMGSGGSYGTTLADLATQTGGSAISICQSDFANALSSIQQGGFSAQITSITLKQTPIVGTVVIMAQVATPQFTVSGNVVTFAQPLPAGALISISYQVPPTAAE